MNHGTIVRPQILVRVTIMSRFSPCLLENIGMNVFLSLCSQLLIVVFALHVDI